MRRDNGLSWLWSQGSHFIVILYSHASHTCVYTLHTPLNICIFHKTTVSGMWADTHLQLSSPDGKAKEK